MAHTGTDKIVLDLIFRLQIQTQLVFAVWRGPAHSRSKLFQNEFLFHSRYRYRDIILRAQNDYTHIFIVWELISQLHRTSVTQGFLAETVFLV